MQTFHEVPSRLMQDAGVLMPQKKNQITQPPAKPRLAFTLIELLIVVAIIALLAAILFPVFSRARENARRTSCASNLKQLALGMIQYAQDYDERLPIASPSMIFNHPAMTQRNTPACNPTTAGCVRWSWHDLIFPYVKSAQVYNDPVNDNRYFDGCRLPTGASCSPHVSNWDSTSLSTGRPKAWVYVGQDGRAYDHNGIEKGTRDALSYGYVYQNQPATTGGIPVSSIAFPSKKALIAESFNLQANAYTALISRHFDGVNVAFADGHVKWIKWEAACTNKDTNDDTKHFWYVNGVDVTSG